MPIKKPAGVRVLDVDMTGVEQGGMLLEDGNYVATVKSVEHKISQSGNPMLTWVFKVEDNNSDASTNIFYNTSLQKQALFNLKGMLIALGQDIPDGVMSLNLDDYTGATCIVGVTSETYNEKTRNKIISFAPYQENML